ncbi:cobalamin-dependent protein [Streptomyces sp. NPDC005970]|uniref:cobalamin B12-binding domain-containing protein n=1 Tax=Streptomyces sp. NPDC005970 TaxID=3156723 RepID=UPI0033CB1C01
MSSDLLSHRRAGSGVGAPDTSAAHRGGLRIVLTSTASDAHTWNLVFLQLLLEELGHRVVNLGPCVPEELLIAKCTEHRPDLIVVSTVNGHGHLDGVRLISAVRSDPGLGAVPAVIGGKLGVLGTGDPARTSALLAAGFGAVFEDGEGLGPLRSYLDALSVGAGA